MKSIAEKFPLSFALPPKGFHKRRGRIKPNMDEHLNKQCAYLYELASKATPEQKPMIAMVPTFLRIAEACYKQKKYIETHKL